MWWVVRHKCVFNDIADQTLLRTFLFMKPPGQNPLPTLDIIY